MMERQATPCKPAAGSEGEAHLGKSSNKISDLFRVEFDFQPEIHVNVYSYKLMEHICFKEMTHLLEVPAGGRP
jgi:hypothetical protein